MPDYTPVRTALLSVSDKAGLVEFARALSAMGVKLISTGGTAKALRDAGLAVTPIEDVTGFPEMMDGRVKTLHPKVHGGLLAVRDNPEHAAAMKAHAIGPIDLLCVNLYPFQQTVAKPGVTREDAIENIDIGGPAMVRSASKNHDYVTVVTSPAQYEQVLAEMQATGGATSLALRQSLAQQAFAHTAQYDAAIARFLLPSQREGPWVGSSSNHFPDTLTLPCAKVQDARYGENPHQAAAIYRDASFTGPSVVGAKQLNGKELSYNNVADAAAALDLALALGATPDMPGAIGACVIKHANPCGAAVASSVAVAIDRAIAGDPLAAFGGILACSSVIDEHAAARLTGKDTFLEVVIAPGYTPAALEMLKAKSAMMRVLAIGEINPQSVTATRLNYRSIAGGLLVQQADTQPPTPAQWTHSAGPAPSAEALRAAAAIEIMVRAMSSNAIAIGGVSAAPGSPITLFGGGVGQVDRVTACKLAVAKAGPLASGAIAVSDAFFPFPDGPQILIDAGVKLIVHPGGSKRDQETFDLCNARSVTCMTTGVRRFRH